MNTYATRKSHNSYKSVKHQDDVYSSVKPYSTWQGYALLLALIGAAVVIITVVIPAVM